MDGDVPVSFLKSVVLLDVVKVVSPDDYCPLHLLTLHYSSQYSPADAHIACEWTFLVNIRALCSLWRKENTKAQ